MIVLLETEVLTLIGLPRHNQRTLPPSGRVYSHDPRPPLALKFHTTRERFRQIAESLSKLRAVPSRPSPGGHETGCGPQRGWIVPPQRPRPERDAVLGREVFYTLLEVWVLTERYRQPYNRVRPHSSLGYRPPAPETLMPAEPLPVLVGLT